MAGDLPPSPPWAHDGGDAALIERLEDPATRARIRQELVTPRSEWDNEWQEIAGPEAILVAVVQNPDFANSARCRRKNCG
jgi:dihydroorotase/N-acyl-D-amino-acid deacylase